MVTPDFMAARRRILLSVYWHNEALLAGASNYCVDHGIDVRQVTRDNLEQLTAEPYDGLMGMCPSDADHPVGRLFLEATVPVVELSHAYPAMTAWGRSPSAGELTGAIAAEYLSRRPVASFAFVAYDRWPSHDARWDGFRRALAKDVRPCTRYDIRGSDAAATSRLAGFLLTQPRPMAVFGSVDQNARMVLDAATEAGLTVPGDVYLLGFGNRELYSLLAPVPISTIAMDYQVWGYGAAGLLEDLMAGRAAPGTVRPVPPGAVIERTSTGGEAGGDPLCARALALIRETIADPVGVEGIAASLGVSKSTLDRAFSAAYGEGVAAKRAAIRIEIAKGLLASGRKVEAVARSVGFSSVRAFRSAFAKATGVTPGSLVPRGGRADG